MNLRFTAVEASLNRAEFRWKWLRFLECSFLLGAALCGFFLVFEETVALGILKSKALVLALFTLFAAGGILTWLVIIIRVVIAAPERPWLGAAMERVDRRLLDRLNTLLFLEGNKGPTVDSFSMRIARQTQAVLAGGGSPHPFVATRPRRFSLVFLGALLAMSLVYEIQSPWARLLAAQKNLPANAPDPEKPLEMAAPQTNSAEQDQAWGEVRITDPGSDLKVTKVDVVPLQIEAAANSALKGVGWYSTINGAQEVSHPLPAPSEPRYGVYQPTIYLDEMQLSDWDVMTYYAKASSEKDTAFASEVYFLEVRPFREDILKMPGGENGKAYQALNDLSSLITRQQHVIRETHQHVQKPPDQENLRKQDRKKLSDAESDLGDSVQHLYARMATEMENKPIGEALDNLAKAEKSLMSASELLQSEVMAPAQNEERSGLSDLVAARKMFQKAITEHPKDFDEPSDQEPAPTADTKQKLNEMAEFRNESKAARETLEKALEQQRNIERQAQNEPRSNYSGLGDQEEAVRKSLADFQAQHPKAFDGAEQESKRAQDALQDAADAFTQKKQNAPNSSKLAERLLEQFSEALQNKSAGQQLANAYKLKQMLDQQRRTFQDAAKPDSKVNESELRQTAEAARATLNQLKKTAEQEPTRDAFQPQLRDSLSGQNKVALDSMLAQLAQAQDPETRRQKSGEASEGLGKVSKAFHDSQPDSLRMARQNDALKGSEQDSFNVGMAELQGLVRQAEENRQVPAEAKNEQARQALSNLQAGLNNQSGSFDQAQQLIAHVDRTLKAQDLDVGELKKLMDQLQHFSVETSDRLAKQESEPEVTNIDPSHLPPAYRGRIQKYFQKLSEK